MVQFSTDSIKNLINIHKVRKTMKIQSSPNVSIPTALDNPIKIKDFFSSVFSESNLECSNSIFKYRLNKLTPKIQLSFKLISIGKLNKIF